VALAAAAPPTFSSSQAAAEMVNFRANLPLEHRTSGEKGQSWFLSAQELVV